MSWGLQNAERQEYSTALASRGAANAKGSYVQLLAATGFAYDAITLNMSAEGGGGQTFLVDIAIGAAAAEQVIVPNVLFDNARSVYSSGLDLTLPIAVPAGVRLAACCQEVGGAGTRYVRVGVSGLAGGNDYPPATCGVAINYGAITASTNGVLVDPGASANTWGAWTEIAAATSQDHNGLAAALGVNKQSGVLVDSSYEFQIGIGAAAAEVVLTQWLCNLNSVTNAFKPCTHTVGASIPSGTRLSMRSKCIASGAAAARHPTAILLGF